jgi:hypothetical protein
VPDYEAVFKAFKQQEKPEDPLKHGRIEFSEENVYFRQDSPRTQIKIDVKFKSSLGEKNTQQLQNKMNFKAMLDSLNKDWY